MDWIRTDLSMPSHDVNIFKYDDKPNETRVLKYLLRQELPEKVVNQTPAVDQDWTQVLDEEVSAQKSRVNRNGLMTIIAPRKEPKPAFGVPNLPNLTILRQFPWSKPAWENIRSTFSVHGSIASVINRGYAAQFSSATLERSKAPIIVYNCRSCAKWKDDIALSVTYFPTDNFSYSVFYGCNKDVQRHIANRLENSEDVIAHPMLLAGIFAEEERRRQMGLIQAKLLILVNTNDSLNNRHFNWAHMHDTETGSEDGNQAVDTWLETYELKTGLENWKDQLQKMIAQCEFLEAKYFHPSLTESVSPLDKDLRAKLTKSGVRIRERLEDIIRDYNEHIRQCEMIMEGLTLATQMAHTRANMEIAVRTKLDSSQMRSIALLTMIFLPATFAATLFSMGFFEWQPDEGQVLVSPRIWIYAVVAGGLTVLTVGLWYVFVVKRLAFKRRGGYSEKVSCDEFDD